MERSDIVQTGTQSAQQWPLISRKGGAVSRLSRPARVQQLREGGCGFAVQRQTPAVPQVLCELMDRHAMKGLSSIGQQLPAKAGSGKR